MLVLTQRPGQTIGIGNGIRVTVLSVRGKQVKLGFQASAEVRIVRAGAAKREADCDLAGDAERDARPFTGCESDDPPNSYTGSPGGPSYQHRRTT